MLAVREELLEQPALIPFLAQSLLLAVEEELTFLAAALAVVVAGHLLLTDHHFLAALVTPHQPRHLKEITVGIQAALVYFQLVVVVVLLPLAELAAALNLVPVATVRHPLLAALQ